MGSRLILFDIDQTLIHSAGCGRKALEAALKEILGIENGLKDISMTGKTDTYIVFEVLEKYQMLQSLPPKKDLFLWERYVHHLEIELQRSTEARIAEGILPLLEALQSSPSTYLALLTGNIHSGAKAKLSKFGLWNYFPVGGFGDDHLDRSMVAQIALQRCHKHFGQTFERENIYVIGDSLRDIQAAKALRARAVIVATGFDPYETLLAKEPFALFRNFGNTQAVLKTLEGNPHFEEAHAK